MLLLPPEAEQGWTSLKRHLERSARFTLVFLWTEGSRVSGEIRRRLDDVLRFRASRLEVVSLQDSPEDWQSHLSAALSREPAQIHMRAPLWLELDRHPGDPLANRLRDSVLMALNEKRRDLEVTFERPLLIAVPKSYQRRIWEVAPDLWTIRGIVIELPAMATPFVMREPEAPAARVVRGDPEELSPVKEWRRLEQRAREHPESVSPFVASSAVGALLDSRSLDSAYEIARQGLALARARAEACRDLESERDLCTALDDAGRVARELERLEEAESAYAESLALRRRLNESVRESPIALRDLSVSLDNVGGMARELGRVEEAEKAYAESLALRRRLIEAVGESPTTLRDLFVSLNNVGRMACELGRLEEAGKCYAESLALGRRLIETVGESRTALRDLAVSLNNVGHVARELMRLEEAEKAYAESLALSRRLVEAVGESRVAFRDLAGSLDNVGRVAHDLGRLEEAEKAYGESLALRRYLIQSAGESPTALRDLSVSLDNVGRVAHELGRLEEAGKVCAESLALRRRLIESVGESPTALRDLSVSLDNVGRVAHELGRLDQAEKAYAESSAVRQKLETRLSRAAEPRRRGSRDVGSD